MKIAVGILAIGLSLLVILQGLTMTGLAGPDNLEITEDRFSKGIMYLILALIIFVGAAFSFGLPLVAIAIFVLGFAFTRVLGFPQEDIHYYGKVCLGFAILHATGIAFRTRKTLKSSN